MPELRNLLFIIVRREEEKRFYFLFFSHDILHLSKGYKIYKTASKRK